MEIKRAAFDKVTKITNYQFPQTSKINYIQLIASAKCLNRSRNNRLYCCNNYRWNNRVCNKKKTTFQGQQKKYSMQNLESVSSRKMLRVIPLEF